MQVGAFGHFDQEGVQGQRPAAERLGIGTGSAGFGRGRGSVPRRDWRMLRVDGGLRDNQQEPGKADQARRSKRKHRGLPFG